MTDDTDSTQLQGGLPVVRLRPKANARAIRHGFPWVYADELVIDRRTKALAAGSLAVLQDAERGDLGVVTVNPASKIVARMLDADAGARIDGNWSPAGCAGRWRCASGCSTRRSIAWSMPRPTDCPASSSTSSAMPP